MTIRKQIGGIMLIVCPLFVLFSVYTQSITMLIAAIILTILGEALWHFTKPYDDLLLYPLRSPVSIIPRVSREVKAFCVVFFSLFFLAPVFFFITTKGYQEPMTLRMLLAIAAGVGGLCGSILYYRNRYVPLALQLMLLTIGVDLILIFTHVRPS